MSSKTLKARMESHNAEEAGADDPFSGVINLRAFIYSGDKDGRTFGPKGEGCIKVRKDGYSSAHVGNCSAVVRDDIDAAMRVAGLSPAEREVYPMAFERYSTDQIAEILGIQPSAVRQRVARARRKIQEAADTVAGIGQ